MQSVDKNRVKENWKNRGFSFGVFSDPPGQCWENYSHPQDEIFMVAEGEVELQLGRRKLKPGPGDEVIIPSGKKHSVRNVGRTPSKWFYGYKN